MRKLLVIGVGSGDPGQLTVEAAERLGDITAAFAFDKGTGRAGLHEVRRRLLDRFAPPGIPLELIPDPPRSDDDYLEGVADWTRARAAAFAGRLLAVLPDGATGAVLAWGDPAVYDSTLRILDLVAQSVPLEVDVVPGISSIQLLAARHRISLTRVGRPLIVTTGRRLLDSPVTEDTVVMLDGSGAFTEVAGACTIYWGAYLGMPEEILLAGRLPDVAPGILEARNEARRRHGWIMDIYLLRPDA